MATPQPRRPEHLPDYSEMCLQALVDHGLAEKISLGCALGLLHYYRERLIDDIKLRRTGHWARRNSDGRQLDGVG